MAGKISRTTEGFIEESIGVHGRKYDYSISEYTGVRNPVEAFKGHTECLDVGVKNDVKSSLAELLVVKSS